MLETKNPLRDEALVHADALDQLLQRANEFRLLRPAEELELAQRIERGDLVAKERLINCNLRLVVSIARRYQATLHRVYDQAYRTLRELQASEPKSGRQPAQTPAVQPEPPQPTLVLANEPARP